MARQMGHGAWVRVRDRVRVRVRVRARVNLASQRC